MGADFYSPCKSSEDEFSAYHQLVLSVCYTYFMWNHFGQSHARALVSSVIIAPQTAQGASSESLESFSKFV